MVKRKMERERDETFGYEECKGESFLCKLTWPIKPDSDSEMGRECFFIYDYGVIVCLYEKRKYF